MKGQINQVFIYISALLFMALILLFGVRSIMDFKEKAEFAELTKFVSDFKKEIENYYNFDVGSVKYLSLSVPGKVKQICFFNPDKKISVKVDDDFKFVLETDKQYNMYTLPLDAYPSPAPDFKIPHLVNTADENPLCVDTKSGVLKAVIETKEGKNDFFVDVRKS